MKIKKRKVAAKNKIKKYDSKNIFRKKQIRVKIPSYLYRILFFFFELFDNTY